MQNFQEILEKLKAQEKEIKNIQAFYDKQNFAGQLQELQSRSDSPTFWQDKDFVEVSKKISELKDLVSSWQKISADYNNLTELTTFFDQTTQAPEMAELISEINDFCKRLSSFKVELFLNGKFDKENCFLSITPGAGGTESQDWAEMLLRMYLRYCQKKRFVVTELDLLRGSEAGIKSVSLHIKGKNCYGLLKAEAGVHRLVRISPFDANKRRHTSFAAVFVSPEVVDNVVEILPQDLRIDTYRSTGAGGQHVNTTDSAVRITHLPSGIVVQCQNERSQHQNKDTAMKMLFSRLVELEEQKKKNLLEQDSNKQKIEWGSQIRSYVLHPYKMVKDHRTSTEDSQPEVVLDGEIDDFIEAYLLNAASGDN